jgi:hypothetical protein
VRANEDGRRKAVGSVSALAAPFSFWDGAGFKGAGLETRATTAGAAAEAADGGKTMENGVSQKIL